MECPQLCDGLSGACEAFLYDQPGIQEVRLNPSWRSVILTDDPARWTGDALASLMQALSFDQHETYQPRQPHGEVQTSSSVTWLPLALAAATQQRLAHPVTGAIVRTAQVQGIRIPECTASEYAIGPGVEASVVIHSPPAAAAVCLLARYCSRRRGWRAPPRWEWFLQSRA